MKIFGIDLIPWQVAFLQQWGILPGGKSAGVNVHDRTKTEGVHGPELVHFDERAVQEWTPENSMKYNGPGFDGSENDPYRQHPPMIPQEVWDAAINPEPAQQVPPAFDAKQSKPLTYPMDFPPDFFTRESPSLTPPVDDATTQRALDYIKAGHGQPYVWPGYDDVYHEDGARGLFQFQPGTFSKLDKLLSGEPVTTTMADLPVDIQEANAANLRKRNRNQRNALRQLNKAMVNRLYELRLARADRVQADARADNLQNRINLDAELHKRELAEIKETHKRCDDYRTEEVAYLEAQVQKLKARNKKLRRKLGRLDGE